jgi:hypothetical protein
MQNLKQKDIYSTRDIYLVSTLVTMGFYVVGVDYQIEGVNNRPVGYFSFEDSPELERTVQDYWQGNLVVEPRTFITNLKGLRSQVSNVYKNPNIDTSDLPRKVDNKS